MKKLLTLMLAFLLVAPLWAQQQTTLTQEDAIEIAKREAICRQIVRTDWFKEGADAVLADGYWIVLFSVNPDAVGATRNGDGELFIYLTPDGQFKDYMRGF